jgi:hypothetical protein
MVFLEIPISLAISSIVMLLKPRSKNKSDAASRIFSFITGANIGQETLKTKKVSKVLQLFNIHPYLSHFQST